MGRFDQCDERFASRLVLEGGSAEPRPKVRLTGRNGNAYSILSACRQAMRRAGCSSQHIHAFLTEAKGADYDHLLRVAMTYCDVD